MDDDTTFLSRSCACAAARRESAHQRRARRCRNANAIGEPPAGSRGWPGSKSPGGELSREYALTALSTKPNPIYADRGLTGTCRARRVAKALAACRSGRTLVVTELNRLARSVTRLKIPAAMVASGDTGTEVAERPAQHDPRLPRQAGCTGRLPRAGCATAAARPIRAPFQPTRPRTKAGSRGCRRDGRPGWHQARPGRPGFAQLRVPARNYWIDLPGVPGLGSPAPGR